MKLKHAINVFLGLSFLDYLFGVFYHYLRYFDNLMQIIMYIYWLTFGLVSGGDKSGDSNLRLSAKQTIITPSKPAHPQCQIDRCLYQLSGS